MYTITGTPVFPDNDGVPDLYSIGTGLGRTFRFAGHTRIPYTVLAHTFTVTSLLAPSYKLHGLLHDAAESILGDTVTTWKTPERKEIEDDLTGRIYESLGLQWPLAEDVDEAVRLADLQALRVEADILGHAVPDHPSFLSVDWSEDAARFTREHLKVSNNQWMSDHWPGQRYAAAFYSTLKQAVGVIGNSDLVIGNSDLVGVGAASQPTHTPPSEA